LSETLVRVVGGWGDPRRPFVAGFIHDSEGDRVIRAAPILKRLIGKGRSEVASMARARGWTLETVNGGRDGNRAGARR
jgi:hypothetical protein